MIPTDLQLESLDSANARINIWHGPVRSGKTIGANIRWVKFLLGLDEHDYQGKGSLFMAGVSVGSVLRNVVEPLREMLGDECRYVPSRSIVKILGHDVYIFGAASEGSEKLIRGLTCAGALLDEVTLLNKSFFMQTLARLSIKGAKLFGATNPDSPKHWLKSDFLDKAADHNLKDYLFPITANTYLDPEYIAALSREYTGMWRARNIEGKWVAADGLVYEGFEERAPFVIPQAPAAASSYYITVDYGIQNPTVFLLIGRNRLTSPRIWCEREYYHSGRDTKILKTDKELADDLFEWAGSEVRSKLLGIVVDPSASSFIEELKRRGLPVIKAENEVLPGIQRQARALFAGDYAVCRECRKTIEEYFLYRFDSKGVLLGKDIVVKDADHTKDAERYYFNTVEHGRGIDYDLFAAD